MFILLPFASLFATIRMGATRLYIKSSKIASFFSCVKLGTCVSNGFEPYLLGLKGSLIASSLDVDSGLRCRKDLVPTFHRAAIHAWCEREERLRHSATHLR